MENYTSFSKYGKQFQELLVQIIMEDRPFADQIEEVRTYLHRFSVRS